METHCPRCADYESRVMGRIPGEELPADVVPCEAFAMSDRFRDWAVTQMAREVRAEVGRAGLDRMALVKRQGPT